MSSNNGTSMRQSPVPCDGDDSWTSGIPYLLFPDDPNRPPSPITNTRDNNIRLYIHFGLIVFGFLVAVAYFVGQLFQPIPYGRHTSGSGRLPVPVRIAKMVVALVPNIVFFILSYFLAGQHFNQAPNIVFFCLYVIHYLERGIVNPLVSRYSNTKIRLWIPLSWFLTGLLISYINAEFIGSAEYCNNYLYDPRFLIGLVLFIVGFALNRVADYQLVCLRESRTDTKHAIPKGPLYFLISCPNYFGEGLQWFGWAVMTWSLAGLVLWLVSEATFVPRSRQNHKWLRNQFLDYPSLRRGLIPFIF
ncbi:Steroid 5-alpha-reductase DET2 [Geodia barretti]|uniref:Steroid 5-alpha-reductase DET2 n=1 Tax=Geodia barretti TaxID=519541 RepID=A0AA35TWV8_GEOBA|nr:Steroid 5-alpha-reductase DET2 [Geodia barretti]